VCGVPLTATALALNVTVVSPTGDGFLTLHPGDVAPPATSSINFTAGRVLANNGVQSLAVATGTLAITPAVAGNGTVDVVIDVTGYFE
jgi:predicted RNA methylase